MPEDAFQNASDVDGPEAPDQDHLTVGAWVQDQAGLWHASEHFDGDSGVHTLACYQTLEAPEQVENVALEALDEDERRCPECQAEINDADEVSGYV